MVLEGMKGYSTVNVFGVELLGEGAIGFIVVVVEDGLHLEEDGRIWIISKLSAGLITNNSAVHAFISESD